MAKNLPTEANSKPSAKKPSSFKHDNGTPVKKMSGMENMRASCKVNKAKGQ